MCANEPALLFLIINWGLPPYLLCRIVGKINRHLAQHPASQCGHGDGSPAPVMVLYVSEGFSSRKWGRLPPPSSVPRSVIHLFCQHHQPLLWARPRAGHQLRDRRRRRRHHQARCLETSLSAFPRPQPACPHNQPHPPPSKNPSLGSHSCLLHIPLKSVQNSFTVGSPASPPPSSEHI